jgi:hypothetical protein
MCISKYNQSNEYLLQDYPTKVFQQYLNFHLDKKLVNKNIFYQEPQTSIQLGMFLMDYKFVNYIYDLIAPECDETSLGVLNDEIKNFFIESNRIKNNKLWPGGQVAKTLTY